MKQYCSTYCVLLALTFASAARAELTFSKGKEGALEVVRMTVTPAAEPVPSLRYRLVARDIDLRPGNAAPYYYRAMIDLSSTLGNLRKKYGDEFDSWYEVNETPLSKLPLDK